ncbi:hypothetical protein ALC56_07469 [Trachymyrmex septentrionalis]|uniref:Uncharacterized protein n=1 Tax=Trachymyrmex septentrionalis TaxID=34720 RepID=A0A151JW07_9HYME|nr:hypothetical protein ALC56_07469 [Trachymyrmex septentrionalis]
MGQEVQGGREGAKRTRELEKEIFYCLRHETSFPTHSRYKAATPSRTLRLTFYTTAGLVALEIIMPALSATPPPRWKDLRGRDPYNRADKVAANISALYNLT